MKGAVRYNYPGAIYHVIPRSNNEENIFPVGESRKYYLDKLEAYCKKFRFITHCYCIMKTHPHLILEQFGSAGISKMMHALNTSYAMYFNKHRRRHGRLFCCKYKTLLIDTDTYLLEASRYIHNNPVKAGIVDEPQDYRWSSYSYYIGLQRSSLVTRDKILDILEPVQKKQFSTYKAFVLASPCRLMLTSNLGQGSTLK